MSRPLTGLRVLEFTHAVLGPSCGLILGDLPRASSKASAWAASRFSIATKNIVLNLKDPRGLEVIYKLLN